MTRERDEWRRSEEEVKLGFGEWWLMDFYREERCMGAVPSLDSDPQVLGCSSVQEEGAAT
jgi:hypothetical protein